MDMISQYEEKQILSNGCHLLCIDPNITMRMLICVIPNAYLPLARTINNICLLSQPCNNLNIDGLQSVTIL